MAYPFTDPPAAPQRGDRATFSSRVDAFLTWMVGLIAQLNQFLAQLNSIAFGGAYNITYAVQPTMSVIGTANGGNIYAGPGTLYVDAKDASGASVMALLAAATNTTSAIKGAVRMTNARDPSKWLAFNITSYTPDPSGNYATLGVTTVAGSPSINSYPFSVNDLVVLSFQRVGDKGDSSTLTQVLWARDEKSSGTSGGVGVAGGSVTRSLTVTRKNTISGSGVSGNQISLPAGTYRADLSVPGYNIVHQAYLYNVTDNAIAVLGSSATASMTNTLSVVNNSEFTITATKVFEIRQFTPSNTANGLGFPASTGLGEVYTQVFIEKVA